MIKNKIKCTNKSSTEKCDNILTLDGGRGLDMDVWYGMLVIGQRSSWL